MSHMPTHRSTCSFHLYAAHTIQWTHGMLHNKQEAQLSQRDRAMLHVIEDLAKSLRIIRNDTAA